MKRLEELDISLAPWKVGCDNYPAAGILARDGLRIDKFMNVADARLIAAAPKMYAKAWELVSAFDGRVMTPGHVEALRAALAEAAGESEEK